ncbi:WD repeat domain-containing protein 83-like [Diadema antillarum]|uniref:WD repeat domain-containing protein 83-like n=2 Tax=Diadema antillarum TaxID=105358 RepID=UPI003A8612CE
MCCQKPTMSDSLPTKLTEILDCKQGAVRAVRFNVDGNYCMTCGSDKSLKLWNPKRNLLLKSYSGHGYEVLDAMGSVDNGHLCSCGGDKTVILWDVATGKMMRKYRGHAGRVNCVRFNEDSSVILSGSIDATVKIWDCRSRKFDAIQSLEEARDSVTSIEVSDHEILTGSADGKIRRYDLRNGHMHSDCISKPVTSVCFTKDGQCTLVSSLDSTLRLLDKETGELLGEYLGHENKSYRLDCCMNETDTHVVSGSEDGRICFWDLVQGSMTTTIEKAGKNAVHSLSFHPQEPCLLSASEGLVKVWRPESYTEEEGEMG